MFYKVGTHKSACLLTHPLRVTHNPCRKCEAEEEWKIAAAFAQSQVCGIKFAPAYFCAKLCALAAEPALLR